MIVSEQRAKTSLVVLEQLKHMAEFQVGRHQRLCQHTFVVELRANSSKVIQMLSPPFAVVRHVDVS